MGTRGTAHLGVPAKEQRVWEYRTPAGTATVGSSSRRTTVAGNARCRLQPKQALGVHLFALTSCACRQPKKLVRDSASLRLRAKKIVRTNPEGYCKSPCVEHYCTWSTWQDTRRVGIQGLKTGSSSFLTSRRWEAARHSADRLQGSEHQNISGAIEKCCDVETQASPTPSSAHNHKAGAGGEKWARGGTSCNVLISQELLYAVISSVRSSASVTGEGSVHGLSRDVSDTCSTLLAVAR